MGLSIPHLLVVLLIAALVFGTKRLKDMGSDLGSAVKSFRKAMNTVDAGDDFESAPKQLTREQTEEKK